MKPASEQLMSEPDIVAQIGNALFGTSPIQWIHLSEDYDRIRSLIESVVPGFDEYNTRVFEKRGVSTYLMVLAMVQYGILQVGKL